MRSVSTFACAGLMLCAAAAPVWAQAAQNAPQGTGNTVIGHEAKPDGTPVTGPYGAGESAVVPGQNAINGQNKSRDCAVPGQNANTASSQQACAATSTRRRGD